MKENFNELNLSNEIIRAIEDMGYTAPTEIQAKSIPIMQEGGDVIGLSETGSGKTAAFSIPALQAMDTDSTVPQFMVIAPTRELAMQIAVEIEKISKYMKNVRVATIFGGDSMTRQIRELKRANVIVGTPGRIQDHIRRRTLIMKHLKFVVLDEADEMLNMGFYEDIITILERTPEEKQMMLFSATMPREIMKISNDFLNNPQTVNVISKTKAPSTIEQYFYYVSMKQKKNALLLLLQYYNPQRSIIFTNTKRMADELSMMLRGKNMSANALHGDMPQNIRTRVLNEFRNGQLNFLIATDVAARGIDIDDIDLVINYDLPQTNEYYIHRIGRTGRAGKAGTSITLVNNNRQLATLKQLRRLTNSDIIERALPSKKDMENQIIQGHSTDILEAINEKIHPLAIELVDNIKKQSNGELNDLGVAYLLANKLVGEVSETFELDDIDQFRQQESRGDRGDRGNRRGDRDNRRGDRDNKRGDRDNRRGDTRERRPSTQTTPVMVSIGRNEQARPKSIANAIVKGLRVRPTDVGDIKLHNTHSIVMMDKGNAEKLIKLGTVKIDNTVATVEKAD